MPSGATQIAKFGRQPRSAPRGPPDPAGAQDAGPQDGRPRSAPVRPAIAADPTGQEPAAGLGVMLHGVVVAPS